MQELARSRAGTRYLKRELHEGPKGASLTLEQIEGYLSTLASKGRAQGTIDLYRRGLERLYRDLPEEDKVIRPNTLCQWREQLLQEGYSASAVNLFIVAARPCLKNKSCTKGKDMSNS